jgi:hypothetical protein
MCLVSWHAGRDAGHLSLWPHVRVFAFTAVANLRRGLL